ncbi:LSU ribosomal protein L6P [Desulfocicer vacuolatum DSM 3385]|uniref:Large ribosomal subunit protein uL6 n=1 Tax=Desulfocicer vacuolatum DSM 3385 TaxID=1121400 RepID=A0A1W1YIA1_9BACT|nr:50S ribosomal protein L6 [Desulfocicer vacuolatum]SMC35846.1 LSU ribosomal protein L6P [Desulfocicer vacuolatum DSM 3385]
MSRIGKKPVQIPEKVEIALTDDSIAVKGALGSLQRSLHPAVTIKIEEDRLLVSPVNEDRKTVALQGLYRSLIQNMVIGVTTGYVKTLLLNGIGYRAEAKGSQLILNVGYSNPVDFTLPDGVTAKVDKNTQITLSSIDKEVLGETAARIRKVRPPEPYKGKGIMYSDERIIRKAGKAAAK